MWHEMTPDFLGNQLLSCGCLRFFGCPAINRALLGTVRFWKRLRSLDVTEILGRDIESACEYLAQHGGSATPPKLHDAYRTSAKC